MSTLEIHQFLTRADNYAVLVHDPASGATAAIDAPDAGAIARELEAKGWRLSHILTTHHHGDHTEGNAALKATTGCTIFGPAREADKIPGIDRTLVEGDRVTLGGCSFQVLETPGHTLGHISYYCDTERLAFVGDTLFAMGCGRVIEGDYPMMWASLSKIAALPPETTLYCGHEYTLANARFALSIEPRNIALQRRARAVAALVAEGQPTLPTRLDLELETNPFLRADSAIIRASLGLIGAPASAVFGEIRDRKNRS